MNPPLKFLTSLLLALGALVAGVHLAAGQDITKTGAVEQPLVEQSIVEQSMAKMKVPEGFVLELVAAEPLVRQPVAIDFDDRGRLWVIQYLQYPNPNGLKRVSVDRFSRTKYDRVPEPPPHGHRGDDRITILEDTDGDGRMDREHDFVNGLNLASGMALGHDGVFVLNVPYLLFYPDHDRDDTPDSDPEVLLTGFGMEDRHELLNSFTWGPDGWMYFTHGVFTNSKVHRPTVAKETGTTLNAGIYRVQFTASDKGPEANFHEVFADGTSNPWGCDYDAAGNWFVEACVIDHLFHMAPGGLYQRQGGAPENPYAYELLPSIVNHKHFRAAYAGIQVYQGGRYPKDTDGHLFFGNIHDNSIHE